MNADPSVKSAPTEPMVRVYNKSPQQSFIHGDHRAAPSSFTTVPRDVAERWFRLFPDTVVEAGVAQKELGGVQAELSAERAKVAALEAELAKLKTASEEKKKRIVAPPAGL
jgi:hypothetical protein